VSVALISVTLLSFVFERFTFSHRITAGQGGALKPSPSVKGRCHEHPIPILPLFCYNHVGYDHVSDCAITVPSMALMTVPSTPMQLEAL
jgi:hypothetical protein